VLYLFLYAFILFLVNRNAIIDIFFFFSICACVINGLS
jgi:hypothetical protein